MANRLKSLLKKKPYQKFIVYLQLCYFKKECTYENQEIIFYYGLLLAVMCIGSLST